MQIVKSVYVNIYDYVEAQKTGGKVVLIKTYKAWCKDVRDRTYPKKLAKRSEFLKGMLKEVKG